MALFDLSNSEWLIIAPCCRGAGRSMAVLVWMTERCSMASSLSCAPARRGAICRRCGPYTATYNRFNLWAKKGHLAAHLRELGSQLATIVAADRQLDHPRSPTRRGLQKGGPDSAIGRSRGAPRPMPRSIRQGADIRHAVARPSFRRTIAPVLIVQLEPSRGSSPNVAMTRAPVSIWSLAAATISHLDLP